MTADRTPTRRIAAALAMLLLLLHEAGAVKVQHTLTQASLFQSYDSLGEFVFDVDKEEIFYVDFMKKQAVWRLPQFGEVASFEAQGALAVLAAMKSNLDVLKKMSKNATANNVAPEVIVFSENPVELGEPNILICFMAKFFPPVINATWLKNGQRVTEGVAETDFYPNSDLSFGKFLYLTFIPTEEDEYACSVDHWGQEHTVNTFWAAQVSNPTPEQMETVVCALGLAVCILCIVVGTFLICRSMKNSNPPRKGGGAL